MNQLQSEILLSIFKNLDSLQMIRMMRVCKAWFEIINENKSVWRRLILLISPNRLENRGSRGWDVSIVELFDRKSASSLQEVSLVVHHLDMKKGPLIETLERSKGTLQYLHIALPCTSDYPYESVIHELAWKLPNLVDLVIDTSPSTPSVRLKDESQVAQASSSLRTLWLPSIQSISQKHLYLLDSVVSLRVDYYLFSRDWRRILEKPAQTLKHLEIAVNEGQDSQLATLDFPNLRLSEVSSYNGEFPSWMKVPNSSTLITGSKAVLTTLPSVSSLWISSLIGIEEVSRRFPNLYELRICPVYVQMRGRRTDLLLMLRERKKNVKNGMQVDGVQMSHLRTLVLRFEDFTQKQISQLKSTGTEVVDLDSVDRFVEVVI